MLSHSLQHRPKLIQGRLHVVYDLLGQHIWVMQIVGIFEALVLGRRGGIAMFRSRFSIF